MRSADEDRGGKVRRVEEENQVESLREGQIKRKHNGKRRLGRWLEFRKRRNNAQVLQL